MGNKDGAVLGNFKAGDIIGLYLEDASGKLFTSSAIGAGTASGLQDFGGGYIGFVWINQFGNPVGEYNMYLSGTPGSSPDAPPPPPSGQPLPGVLSSALIAAAALTFARKCKIRRS